jgi:uncharacterized protein
MQPFTLLIKPSGSDCNLDCKYCFYKHRAAEVGRGKQRMSDEVLEKLIKDYMQLKFPLAGFAWQGGEPTLMGLDFYKRAVELQKQFGIAGQEVGNSLQTNAVLIDDRWGHFLHENNFLVGISIDGPKEFNDYYRLDNSGAGTFDKVLRAINTCKEHKVEFNTLTLLNNINADHPDRVFDFLIENGVRFLQFIPCVELDPATNKVTDFSITPAQYGEFLCRIFDRWFDFGPTRLGEARRSPTKLSIRDFDSILSYYVTGKHTICTFDKQCSQYIVIEHTGDAFTCDFFVEPKWRLGNIFETPIQKLATDSKKRAFARAKQNLCNKCLVCRHLAVCRGGCMKDRVMLDAGYLILDENRESRIEVRESYFCESYKRFFDYTIPKFVQLAAEINASAPAKNEPFR